LFKVLCQFVWRNYCWKHVCICMEELLFKVFTNWNNTLNKNSFIQIHTILWTIIPPYKFTQYFEQELFHTNSHNTLNKNSSIQIHTILWTRILSYKFTQYFEQEFLHTNWNNTLNKNSFMQLCKGQYTISYCQRPPISLKILLNISSLISAQFCNEMCAYE
jgi:hypothetical protein